MKHPHLASFVALVLLAALPQLTIAAETGSASPASKAAAAKPEIKDTKPANTKKDRATSEVATDASLLMGAFQSDDGFLVSVRKSADGDPSKDVLVTIMPATDPKNPRFCMMFGDAKVTSASQTKVRVTQYQPRHVHHSIPACSVTLEASKDQLRLTGHSAECESLCLGVPEAYVPKQPLVRLKD